MESSAFDAAGNAAVRVATPFQRLRVKSSSTISPALTTNSPGSESRLKYSFSASVSNCTLKRRPSGHVLGYLSVYSFESIKNEGNLSPLNFGCVFDGTKLNGFVMRIPFKKSCESAGDFLIICWMTCANGFES